MASLHPSDGGSLAGRATSGQRVFANLLERGPVEVSDEPTILELSIRSHCDEVPRVREEVRRLTADEGFDDEAVARVALAMDEALANIINHGYEGAEDQPIDIRFLRTVGGDRHGLKIVIRDYGKQVDPKTIRSRDLAEVRPGGLGVHIMNAVMDEVQYDRPTDRGMLLTMIKWLPEAGPRQETS